MEEHLDAGACQRDRRPGDDGSEDEGQQRVSDEPRLPIRVPGLAAPHHDSHDMVLAAVRSHTWTSMARAYGSRSYLALNIEWQWNGTGDQPLSWHGSCGVCVPTQESGPPRAHHNQDTKGFTDTTAHQPRATHFMMRALAMTPMDPRASPSRCRNTPCSFMLRWGFAAGVAAGTAPPTATATSAPWLWPWSSPPEWLWPWTTSSPAP